MKIASLLAQYPQDELDRRMTAVRNAGPPGVEVEFLQIEGCVYRKGLTDLHRSMIAPLVAEKALEAQESGFDAIVPYGTLDLGVEESRHVVDIPIIGPGHSGVSTAAMLAQQFSILTYDEPHVAMFARLVRKWGVADRVTSIRSVGIVITDMVAQFDELRTRFLDLAKMTLEEERAELVLPLGMTVVPVLLSADDLTQELDVPVLDPLALSMSIAATLARTGYQNSRIAYPAASLDRSR
ncbi:MAG: hypothetical protein GEU93_06525 [Propionibacteriales bacterium]|nr:hypothetical protein [Propionibacteriales bacterium]